MSIKNISYDYGCDVCVGCGKCNYQTLVCDDCGTQEDMLYSIDNTEFCYECLEKHVMNEYKSDVFGEFFEEIVEMLDIGVIKNDG